ncbi:MAG: hypothetical protein NT075_32995 [Chloroflexi bacterium]|nr:hypothetical protein [Chloroflexota bacterium]
MATRQLEAPSALHTLTHPLLILGQILLLIVTWSIFFLWSLLMAESLFFPWIVVLTGGEGFLANFFVAGIGLYLLAFSLVVISVMLFFYRMPRAQEKISVSLEFTLTLLVFMGIHLFVISLVLPWAGYCLPVPTHLSAFTSLSVNLSPTSDFLSSVQTCQYNSAGLLFTLLLLTTLFLVQARTVFSDKSK